MSVGWRKWMRSGISTYYISAHRCANAKPDKCPCVKSTDIIP